MPDRSGETGLVSGTESRRGTGTGIGTGTERETEDLEVGGVHSVMEGEGEAVIGLTGGTGSGAGRKTAATTVEDGTETERGIGTETGIGTGTETETGTETDGRTGGTGEAAWIATENAGGPMTGRGITGEGTEGKERRETEGVETEGEELKAKKGSGRGGQSDERGPHAGTRMTAWPK